MKKLNESSVKKIVFIIFLGLPILTKGYAMDQIPQKIVPSSNQSEESNVPRQNEEFPSEFQAAQTGIDKKITPGLNILTTAFYEHLKVYKDKEIQRISNLEIGREGEFDKNNELNLLAGKLYLISKLYAMWSGSYAEISKIARTVANIKTNFDDRVKGDNKYLKGLYEIRDITSRSNNHFYDLFVHDIMWNNNEYWEDMRDFNIYEIMPSRSSEIQKKILTYLESKEGIDLIKKNGNDKNLYGVVSYKLAEYYLLLEYALNGDLFIDKILKLIEQKKINVLEVEHKLPDFFNLPDSILNYFINKVHPEDDEGETINPWESLTREGGLHYFLPAIYILKDVLKLKDSNIGMDKNIPKNTQDELIDNGCTFQIYSFENSTVRTLNGASEIAQFFKERHQEKNIL